jgi:predicted ATPase/DNA-binding winged helix-turn-helix (wHTH) protein
MTSGALRLRVGVALKQFESFRLDTANECLLHNGEEIALPPKPYAVLRYLVENPGRLITHDELLDALWPETFVQPQVLRTYMLELRKILGDDTANPRFIQTLPKRGYCFIAPVTEWSGAESSVVPAAIDGKPRVIVGREEEMATLDGHLRALTSGQRRIVFVTGEAGIGKTALVDAFCRQCGQAMMARGQCVEGFGAKEEYYPVIEALSRLCESADGEAACRVLARRAPAWLAAVGREAGQQPAPPTTAAARMPGDLCAALEELAAFRPLILLFEDLHWADDATLNLISALARRRAPAQLLVLGTCSYRDTANDQACKVLKQDLLMRQLASEMALTPLTRSAVKQLLIRELQQELLPPGLSGFVHQHSEGNPLFAIAILEHLIAQGFLVRESHGAPSAWKPFGSFGEMEAAVPDGLAQMIELEIERLSADDQQMLEAASLMGIAFPVWAVAAALEQDPLVSGEACAALARRLYFVKRAGEDELPDGTRSDFYVFGHGLYRQVLYQRQSASRRAARHKRIALRLGELFAGREASVARERAMHFEAAGDWLSAAIALRSAARHAQQRKAHAEAEELLQHALRLAGNLGEIDRAAATRLIHDELAAAAASAPKAAEPRTRVS